MTRGPYTVAEWAALIAAEGIVHDDGTRPDAWAVAIATDEGDAWRCESECDAGGFVTNEDDPTEAAREELAMHLGGFTEDDGVGGWMVLGQWEA